MFSSSDCKKIGEALPIVNTLSTNDFERLCGLVLSKLKSESTPTTEKHLGDSLKLSSNDLSLCIVAVSCILETCILNIIKPLALLKSLQDVRLSEDKADKLASIWALNAQQMIAKARGDSQLIQAKQISIESWEIIVDVASPRPKASVSLRVGGEVKVLHMDKEQLYKLFDNLQQIQKQLDNLLT